MRPPYTMVEHTDPITRAEFAEFAGVVNHTFTVLLEVASNSNRSFTHIHKRLDDIDRRLEMIESRSKTMEGSVAHIQVTVDDMKADVLQVKNEDRNVSQAFDMLEGDGKAIAKLQRQIKKLAARLGEET